MKIQTEEQKLRAQIPLTNAELIDYLKYDGISFELDSAGIPWLSNSTIRHILNLQN